MSRKSFPAEQDEFTGLPETMTRKQVLEALRKGTSLVECDLRGTDLSGVNFDGVNLRNAKLADANLAGCSFRGATLSGASLWHADLREAVLDGADLEEADLDFANLDGATVKGAKIKKAIFPFKRLSMEDLHEAVRSGRRLHMVGTQVFEDDE